MNKWGDWDQVDTKLLQRVNAVLVKQQAIAGDVHCPDFSPAKVIMDNSATKGLAMLQSSGQIISFGSIAINNFMLGYLYRLAEEGRFQEIFAEMGSETNIGGANNESEPESESDDRTAD